MKNSHLSIKITELASWDVSKTLPAIDSPVFNTEKEHDKIIERFVELQNSSNEELKRLVIDHILDTHLTRYNDALKLKKEIEANRKLIDRIKGIITTSYNNFINSAILFSKRS